MGTESCASEGPDDRKGLETNEKSATSPGPRQRLKRRLIWTTRSTRRMSSRASEATWIFTPTPEPARRMERHGMGDQPAGRGVTSSRWSDKHVAHTARSARARTGDVAVRTNAGQTTPSRDKLTSATAYDSIKS